MKEIRVGFIGTGVISHRHMKNYEKIPYVKVVAICDIDKAKMDAWGERYGIPEKDRYTDYRELLARDDIDSVDVCVHNNLHAPLSIAVMKAGKHCFCEKPMAASYRDAKTMYDAWNAISKPQGKEFGIQISTLYEPQTRLARKMVQAGDLGHVYYVRCLGHRRRGRPGLDMTQLSKDFFSRELAGHGALFDMGIYHIAQMLFILGLPELKSVSGSVYTELAQSQKVLDGREFGVEELGLGFAKFENNLTFDFMESWALMIDEVGSSFIAGSKGGLRFVSDPPAPFGDGRRVPGLKYITRMSERDVDIDLRVSANTGFEHGDDPDLVYYDENHAHWYAFLSGKIPARYPTAEIALATAKLSEGIFLSSQLGREIQADEIEGLSVSTAMRRQETPWGVFEYDF